MNVISRIFVFPALVSVVPSFVNAQSDSDCSKSFAAAANKQFSSADKIDKPFLFTAENWANVGDFFKETIERDFGDGFTNKMRRAAHSDRNSKTYTLDLIKIQQFYLPN